ncbi:MAG: hypothetical protein J7639_09565 [Paenibacillaceae bacterium]|nr:hypothetical protein [Paenibacillaceae bacterium]
MAVFVWETGNYGVSVLEGVGTISVSLDNRTTDSQSVRIIAWNKGNFTQGGQSPKTVFPGQDKTVIVPANTGTYIPVTLPSSTIATISIEVRVPTQHFSVSIPLDYASITPSTLFQPGDFFRDSDPNTNP